MRTKTIAVIGADNAAHIEAGRLKAAGNTRRAGRSQRNERRDG